MQKRHIFYQIFFLVDFNSLNDRDVVLDKNLWQFEESFTYAENWVPNFDP
jgi:hypothetical protein